MTLNFMNAVRVCREGEKLGRWGFFREALKIYLIYLSSLLSFYIWHLEVIQTRY